MEFGALGPHRVGISRAGVRKGTLVQGRWEASASSHPFVLCEALCQEGWAAFVLSGSWGPQGKVGLCPFILLQGCTVEAEG